MSNSKDINRSNKKSMLKERKRQGTPVKAAAVVSQNTEDPIMKLTGSSRAVGKILLSQVFDCLPESVRKSETGLETVVALFYEIKPKNQLEALLLTQMISVHFASMLMVERCMGKNQPHDVVSANVNRMAKLMGVFTRQMEALEKYRGGGKQTIQVQHVHVSDNAQAVVGDVHVGGGNG